MYDNLQQMRRVRRNPVRGIQFDGASRAVLVVVGLITSAAAWHPALAQEAGEIRPWEVGTAFDYIFLGGAWSDLGSGPGVTAFGGLRVAPELVVRANVTASRHHEQLLDLESSTTGPRFAGISVVSVALDAVYQPSRTNTRVTGFVAGRVGFTTYSHGDGWSVGTRFGARIHLTEGLATELGLAGDLANVRRFSQWDWVTRASVFAGVAFEIGS